MAAISSAGSKVVGGTSKMLGGMADGFSSITGIGGDTEMAEAKTNRQQVGVKKRALTEAQFDTEKKKWEGDDTKISWDYCLVFKVAKPDDEKAKNAKLKPGRKKWDFAGDTQRYLDAIRAAGLRTALYLSVQEDEVYCLLGITEKRLREEASRLDYDLPLEMDEVLRQGKDAQIPLITGLESNSERDSLLNKNEWRTYYGRFDDFDRNFPDRQLLYKKQKETDPHRSTDTFFTPIDRLRLILFILEASPLLRGAGLSIFRLKKKKKSPLIEAFPLHDPEARDSLEEVWMAWFPLFSQPLMNIRNYFGEQVGYYFAFLSFYCQWLIVPSVLGLVVFIQQLTNDFNVDVESLPLVALGVALWATLFLEFWKRKEAMLRVDWGMTNYVLKEPPRPEFSGEFRRDPRNGEIIKYFPIIKRLWRIFQSQVVIWMLISVVVILVVGIFFLRAVLRNVEGGNIYASLINAVQIQIMNFVYGLVATKLNDYENHKTASEYSNALIAKSFLFKFINSYNSFFYIAFFKQLDKGVGGCPSNDSQCLGVLQVQLAVVFGSSIVVNNSLELLIPFIKNWRKARANAASDEETKLQLKKSVPEVEAEFQPYTTFSDYDEMVVQFGYVTIFVVAFPMSPLMALFNNYLEIRIDAHKILRLSQRPPPQGAATIGTWFDILTIVSFIAVFVNAMICVFKTEVIHEALEGNFQSKVILFVISEHAIIVMKILVSYFVEDVPRVVQDHVARQEYLNDILINGTQVEAEVVVVADDDDDDEPMLGGASDQAVSDAVTHSGSGEYPKLDYSTIAKNMPSPDGAESQPAAIEVVTEEVQGSEDGVPSAPEEESS